MFIRDLRAAWLLAAFVGGLSGCDDVPAGRLLDGSPADSFIPGADASGMINPDAGPTHDAARDSGRPDGASDGAIDGAPDAAPVADTGPEADASPDSTSPDSGVEGLRCPDDDIFEPNDAPNDATPLPDGPFEAILCGERAVDFYALGAVAQGCTVQANARFVQALGDIDLVLFDAQGDQIAAAISVDDDEALEHLVAADSPLFLAAALADGQANTYQLAVEISCPPQPCVDDALEENDALETASPLPEGVQVEAVSCPADPDWFRFAVAPGCSAVATVELPEGQAVQAELTAHAADGQRLAGDDDPADGLSLRVAREEGGVVYFALTPGDETAPGPYSIRAESSCPPRFSCPRDDPFEEDDNPATATRLAPGQTLEGIICGADPDLFQIIAPAAGCALDAQLEFNHAEGDLDLWLVDAEGTLIVGGEAGPEGEVLSAQLDAAGAYYLDIHAAAGADEALSNSYRVRTEWRCPEPLSCPGNDVNEPDNTLAEATALPAFVDVDGILCGDADYYAIEVEHGCRVEATVRTEDGVPIALSLHDAERLLGRAAPDDGGAALGVVVASDGPHYLRVEQPEGEGLEYTLSYGVQCADFSCPEDDAREPDGRDAPVLIESGAPIEGILCGESEDWISLEGFAGCSLEAALSFGFGDSVLGLEVVDAEGRVVLEAEAAGADGWAGRALLDVDGLYRARIFNINGGASAVYSAQLTLDCEGVLRCPNDDANEDDDVLGDANPAAPGTLVEGILCAGDEDWLTVEAEAGCEIAVSYLFDHGAGDLDGTLFDPNGRAVATGQSRTDNEDFRAMVQQTGTYAIRASLRDDAPGNTYSVVVDLDCPCASDDAAGDNDVPADATPLADGATLPGVVCTGDVDYFLTQVQAGCGLIATVDYGVESAPPALRLEDANGAELGVGVVDAGRVELTLDGLDGGAYYLALAGEQNPYEISVTQICPPPACIADAQEDDDTLVTATPLVDSVPVDGTICADDDYFALPVAAGCVGTFVVRLNHSDGDLDLELLDGAGQRLGLSDSATDLETAATAPAADSTIYARVFGYRGAQNSYQIEAREQCGFGLVCPADDGFEPNDTPAQSTPLAPRDIMEAVLCAGDADLYAVELAAGCGLNARVDTRQQLALSVVDAAGQTLADGFDSVVEYTTIAETTVYLQLTGGDAALYDLSYRISCAGDLVCPDDDANEDNDALNTASPLLAGVPTDAILCGPDPDYYRVQGGAGCTLTARADFDASMGDLDLRLLDAAGQPIAQAEALAGPEGIEMVLPGDGPYFLQPFAPAGEDIRYSLSTQLSCPERCNDDIFEENDTAADASMIPIGQQIGATFCSGDEDFFGIEVAAGCLVSARLVLDPAQANLDLRLVAPNGAVIASSLGLGAQEQLEQRVELPGTYTLRISGALEPNADAAAYVLTTNVDCAPPPACVDDAFEENDSVDTAAALPNGPLNGQLCTDDDDYFRFETPVPDCAVTATLNFDHGSGDLDLQLLDALGVLVGRSETAANVEQIAMVLPRAGRWSTRIFGWNHAENTYEFGLELVCPEPLSCPADDAFEPNDALAEASPLPRDTRAEAIICGANQDLFVFTTAEAGCVLDAQLRYTAADGNLVLTLLDDQGQQLATADTAGDDELLQSPLANGADYVLQIESAGDDLGYALEYALACPSDLSCPEDDPFEALADPAPIPVGTPVRGIICADTDAFQVAVPAGCQLFGRIEFVDADGDLDLYLTDENGNGLSESRTLDDIEQVDAYANVDSAWVLRVEGFLGESNTYTLTTWTECDRGELVINEVRYIADGAEFVELYNIGAAPVALGELSLELVDAQGATYQTVDLGQPGDQLDVGQYLLIGDAAGFGGAPPDTRRIVANFDLLEAPAGLRISSPRGVLDAVSYGGSVPGLTEGVDGAPSAVDGSVGRCDNGVDTNDNAADFRAGANTPGAANTCIRALECPGSDDRFEDNDTQASSFPILPGGSALAAIACDADADWFVFDVRPGCTYTTSLRFFHIDGDLDLRLVGVDGTELDRSASVDDNEVLEYTANALTQVHAVVSAVDGANNTYGIELTESCAARAPRLVINEVEYDEPVNDVFEFVEIYNAGGAEQDLNAVVVSFFDGAGGVIAQFPLVEAAPVLPAGGYLVIGSARILAAVPAGVPTLVWAGRLGNSGGGVAIDEGVQRLDSMSYEIQIDGLTEGAPAPDDINLGATDSIGRCGNGTDTDSNARDFIASRGSPGTANTCP